MKRELRNNRCGQTADSMGKWGCSQTVESFVDPKDEFA